PERGTPLRRAVLGDAPRPRVRVGVLDPRRLARGTDAVRRLTGLLAPRRGEPAERRTLPRRAAAHRTAWQRRRDGDAVATRGAAKRPGGGCAGRDEFHKIVALGADLPCLVDHHPTPCLTGLETSDRFHPHTYGRG